MNNLELREIKEKYHLDTDPFNIMELIDNIPYLKLTDKFEGYTISFYAMKGKCMSFGLWRGHLSKKVENAHKISIEEMKLNIKHQLK